MDYRYRFILGLWGKKFVSRFLDYGLPTQLAPGNLPALPAGRCVYHIFTPSGDAEQFRNALSFQHLQRLMPTTLETIDDVYLGHSYAAMTECHNRGLAHGRGEDCAFVFLSPDSLWSDGSFRHMHQLTVTGKRAVLLAAPRLVAEEVLPTLPASSPDDGSIRLSGRQLSDLMMRHLHPASRADTWVGVEGSHITGGYFQFEVEKEGLVVRAPSLHPLVIRSGGEALTVKTTVDCDFLWGRYCARGDCHVVTDSDDMCAVEFSDADYLAGMFGPRVVTMDEHVDFLRRNMTDECFHRDYLQRKIRLHARPLTPAWDSVESLSDSIVAELLRRLALSDEDTGARVRATVLPGRSGLAGVVRSLSGGLLHRQLATRRIGPIEPRLMRHDDLVCYHVSLTSLGIFSPGDGGKASADMARSRIVLLEDGLPLGPPHQNHNVIRNKGRGAYSHWGDAIYFSASDNSDPRTNGRAYEIDAPVSLASSLRRLWWGASRFLRLRRRTATSP
jgi:hypothetical protein